MTAELNNHQRAISYYTGAKLIRHHQNQNNNSSTNAATNSTANPTSAGAGGSSSTATPGGYFHPHNHHHHFPIHGPPPHPPPPLPPHHPGNFHLPCPTGPPHLQHPGGMLHLSNHHGPPHHPHGHFAPGGGGAGSNQATRLYAGSPLIRSSAFHSVNGSSGNHKRSYKHHNRGHQIQSGNFNGHHVIPTKFGGVNQSHHHHQPNIIIGGSCSSGASSSSSSNEHLNSFQSPTGSPTATAKLDITPLKLSSASSGHGDSSSNNSSPGPQGSPSPSVSSVSPSSSDGNKDLDHFYFLDEHWKPNSDISGGRNNGCGSSTSSGDIMDMSSSTSSIMGSQWTNSSSGSPSPPASTNNSALTMMVDQFFATRDTTTNNNNHGFSNLVDANNNVVESLPLDFNEIGRNPQPRGDSDLLHSFSNGGFINSGNSCIGASGLFNFGDSSSKSGGGTINSRNSRSTLSGEATTVVNVETQIGTFNGQRDLEIRLCFIKGDHHNQRETREQDSGKFKDTRELTYVNKMEHGSSRSVRNGSVIGDPFSSSNIKTEHVSISSTTSNNAVPSNSSNSIGLIQANNSSSSAAAVTPM